MGHRLTTPDPAPICARIVAESQRHTGHLSLCVFWCAWLQNVARTFQLGIQREFTVIERCRIVESKSFAPCGRPWLHSSLKRRCSSRRILRWFEYSESMWQRVTPCDKVVQIQSETLWPIQFPLKRHAISKIWLQHTPTYSKQIRLRKRSQRVWQSTVR